MNDSLIVNIGWGVYLGVIGAMMTLAIAVTLLQLLGGLTVLIGRIARVILKIEN
jgi:uncharacterized membrane protein YphA (DoxX/SURF4 family)